LGDSSLFIYGSSDATIYLLAPDIRVGADFFDTWFRFDIFATKSRPLLFSIANDIHYIQRPQQGPTHAHRTWRDCQDAQEIPSFSLSNAGIVTEISDHFLKTVLDCVPAEGHDLKIA